MKLITIILSIAVSSLSFAGIGGGHSHGQSHSHGKKTHSHSKGIENIDAKKAEELARKRISKLALKKKVDTSWNKSKLVSAEKKEFMGKKEWLVTFSNENGTKGKLLYIFLKLNGEFVAANFTGK